MPYQTDTEDSQGRQITPIVCNFTTCTGTGPTIAATSTSALAANTSRKYAVFVNDSDEAIYLGLGAAAVLNKGIRLNASGGSYEINALNLFTGIVYAICTSGNKILCVMECV